MYSSTAPSLLAFIHVSMTQYLNKLTNGYCHLVVIVEFFKRAVRRIRGGMYWHGAVRRRSHYARQRLRAQTQSRGRLCVEGCMRPWIRRSTAATWWRQQQSDAPPWCKVVLLGPQVRAAALEPRSGGALSVDMKLQSDPGQAPLWVFEGAPAGQTKRSQGLPRQGTEILSAQRLGHFRQSYEREHPLMRVLFHANGRLRCVPRSGPAAIENGQSTSGAERRNVTLRPRQDTVSISRSVFDGKDKWG